MLAGCVAVPEPPGSLGFARGSVPIQQQPSSLISRLCTDPALQPHLIRERLVAVWRCRPFCKGKWELPEEHTKAEWWAYPSLELLSWLGLPIMRCLQLLFLCYSREKPFALHLATWRRNLYWPPPSQVFPFHLTSLPQLLSLFYMGAVSQDLKKIY